MSLEARIDQDYIQAMKSRDQARSSCVSFLRAQLKNLKIDRKIEKLSDEDVTGVIKKQIKQRQDSITQFRAGGRMELVAKEEAELALLQSYLPTQLSQDQLLVLVESAIKSTGASSMKDMGAVMKEVLAKAAGQADNQAVSALVKERLSKS